MDSYTDMTMQKSSFLKRLLRDQSGATAIEYGLIIGLISMLIIGALSGVASGTNAVYDTAKNSMNAATAS